MKKISARWRNLYTKAGFSSFMASLLAILCGLVVGFVVLLVADPANAFWGLLAILTGGLSDMKNLGQVLYAATPIILTGLSVGFANKTGLFNIGASGQFIVGAYVAVLMGVKCTFIPGPLLWLACLLGAMLAGAVWGLVPGFLKAVCNVNEVIACIMMNYIGMYGVNFLIQLTVFDSLKNQSLPVAENANAPKLGMDLIFRSGATASSANAGIFIAVLAGVVIYYLIEKTKFGYELKACGYNRDAARYAGINETRSIVLSMVIAGALWPGRRMPVPGGRGQGNRGAGHAGRRGLQRHPGGAAGAQQSHRHHFLRPVRGVFEPGRLQYAGIRLCAAGH